MNRIRFCTIQLFFGLLLSCSSDAAVPQTLEPVDPEPISEGPTTPETPENKISDGFLVPSTGEQMLFIGQDLKSVRDYMNECGQCPTPTGITTYVNLSGVLSGSLGALGWKSNNTPYEEDVNWGAGPLNAYKSAKEFPNSAVQIGLYLVGQTVHIAKGDLDAQIRQLASYFNELDDTAFYLRIGYEFDGQWNGYDGNNYQNAFRKIVDVLRGEGVTNVAYVWQSSTSPIDDLLDGGRENLMTYYPGDAYVDWFGVSWFLRLNEQATAASNTISTQKFLLNEMLALARAKGKPVMIAESADQGYDNSRLENSNISEVWDGTSAKGTLSKTADQIWNEWYAPYFDYIESNADVIKAISYINADWDSQGLWDNPYENGYWGDSRIQVNETLESKWLEKVTATGWISGSEELTVILGLK